MRRVLSFHWFGVIFWWVATCVLHAAPLPTSTTLSVAIGGLPAVTVPVGTTVVLTARVLAGASNLNTGQIVFCDAVASSCSDIHRLGLAQLTSAGTATLTFRPGPGTHSYTAKFLPTTSFAASTSAAATLIVLTSTGPIVSTVGVQGSGGQGDYSLLGTVATNGPAPPTGQVSFVDTNNAGYQLGTTGLGPTGSNGISFLNSFNFPIQTFANTAVVTGDFNGDGIPDIASATITENSLHILLGNGNGTFRSSFVSLPSQITGFLSNLVTADFNGDGRSDLAVVTVNGLLILVGNGDGTFQAGTLLSNVSIPLITGDFNNDGVVDIVAGANGGLTTFLGNGDGTFRKGPVTPLTASPFFIAVADFNSDGKMDLAITELPLNVVGQPFRPLIAAFLGNGDGSFNLTQTVDNGNQYGGLAIADLNGDGIPDIVAGGSYAPAAVLLGNGDGTFRQLPDDANTNYLTSDIALADFNGDGIPDLVLPDANGGTVNVFIGRGDGTFVPDVFSPSVANFTVQSVATADFNGDGQTDIVEGIYDNNGGAVLHDQVSVLLAQAPSTAAGYLNHVSPVGTGYHDIEAVYPGDSNNQGGISATVPLLALQVTTQLTLNVTPTGGSSVGQAVTLSANLDQHFAQNHEASGNVVFTNNGRNIGSVTVANGVATLTTSALPAGSDNLKAVYAGDSNFLGSASSVATYPVTMPQPQTISFPQPSNPEYAGTAIYLSATASSGLAVSYQVVSGPGSVNGSVLSFTGVGAVVVEADQMGGGLYSAAAPVRDTVAVTMLTEPVGTTSTAISTVVTFSATGTLGAVGVLTQGAPNLDFTAIAGSTCSVGTTYVAGQNCVIAFAFNPRLPGARYGGIVITSSKGDLLANSYIYGLGVGPLVNYVPAIRSTFLSGIQGPTSLAFDGAGNLFVVQYRTRQVLELYAAGGYQSSRIITGGLTSPTGIAVDGSGNLFVAENDTASDVKEIFASGGYVNSVTLGSGFLYPTAVAVDGNGNVFVADYYNNAVKEIVAASGYNTVLTLGSGFFQPADVAVDSSGNVFVADTYHSQVKEILASGGYQTVFTFPGTFPLASAVKVNASGNVFITSNDGTLKEAFAANGYQTTTTLASSLGVPAGIALDGAGNIYFSEYQNGTVMKFNYVDPPTLTFAPTIVGSTSSDSPQVVTQINNGTANLIFTPPASGTNPSITSSFELSASTCPQLPTPNGIVATLSVGSICTDSVSFKPVSPGAISGMLVTTDNLSGPGSMQTVLLNGTGIAVATAIVFSVPNHIFGDPPFTITATSNSPGAFVYSVVSGPATISGSTVTLTGTGSVTLLASQAASGIYAAGSQSATFIVSAAAPTITFIVPNHTFGDAPFLIAATSNSGGTFTYAVLSGPATVSGSTVTLTGVGSVVLQATQAASGNFTAGTQTATFQVNPGSPTINFAVPNHTFGDAPFVVSASSNSPGAFAYSVLSGPATISGSTVTLTGIGTVVLQAMQAASGNYTAGSKAANFTIGAEAPTITFVVPNHSAGDAPFVVAAVSNSAGTFTYSVVSGAATITGSTVTLTGVGSVTLLASQGANGVYSAGSQTATFAVGKQLQTINFPAPVSPVNFGIAPISLTAMASSGLPVAFTVLSGPGVLNGNLLTLTSAGTVIIAADQAGNASYSAAPEVIRTLVVIGRLVNLGLSATPNPVFLRSPVALAATLAASGGVPSGTITFLDGANSLGTVTISGSTANLLTSSLTLGMHTITASYSGDGTFARLTSAAVVVIVQDFTVSASNPNVTISHGGTATYNLTLSSVGGLGLASAIDFSISGAPDHSEISFSPQSVPSGSGSTPVTLVIHTPNYPVGPFASLEKSGSITVGFIALGALLLPFGRKRLESTRNMRALRLALFVVLGVTGMMALQGCGSGWKSQQWTMLVTASSGNISRTTMLTLTSQCSDGQTACPIK